MYSLFERRFVRVCSVSFESVVALLPWTTSILEIEPTESVSDTLTSKPRLSFVFAVFVTLSVGITLVKVVNSTKMISVFSPFAYSATSLYLVSERRFEMLVASLFGV